MFERTLLVKIILTKQISFQLHPEDMDSFANTYKHAPLKNQTVITCLQTLKKSMADDDAVSCLVLGTESRSVYVLDPEAFTVLANMTLPAVPVLLHVSGLYDVEFRVIVACRDGSVYVLRRGNNNGKLLFSLNSQVTSVVVVQNAIGIFSFSITVFPLISARGAYKIVEKHYMFFLLISAPCFMSDKE